ncbi:MAG: hypothetical protein NWF01_07350 [Candidatus Bathyarchaeota archaeon]|nr:hypothetical protein [Candidatus Bathyarchaeota archaeon]
MADITPLFSIVIIWIFLFVVVIIWAIIKSSNASQTREYGIKSTTLKGEAVKSIQEKRIADYFAEQGINYRYEDSPDYHIRRPDFYLPDFDVYVEYWGLVDADDNHTRTEYVRNMKRKMAIYHSRNKKLISIYPRNMNNFEWIFKTKFREATGFDLPN